MRFLFYGKIVDIHLWKNGSRSSLILPTLLAPGLRRDAHFFVCGRPFALAWAANEIVVHKHV